jgi:photosystem II stability/assembly factor-like uncharacterized protein
VVAVGFLLSAAVAVAAPTAPNLQLKDNLYGVKFIDAKTGWVVGAFGTIARTTDGGATWQAQPSKTTQQLYDVDFVDPQQGWAVGRQGLILHTTDGGATWEQQTSGTGQHLFGVDFIDAQHGIAVGDFGAIVITKDGGQHWEDHKLPEDVVLYDVSMIDQTRGWIAGEFGSVLATTDGGVTWTKQDTGVDKTLFGVYVADAQNGWAVGIDALILRTADGGQTWKVQNGSTEIRELEQVGFGQAYDNPSLYGISVNGSMGVAVGEMGAIYLSSDGGQTWTRQDSREEESGPKWFRAVTLAPGKTGAIVGAAGVRVLVVDGRIQQSDGGSGAAEAVH